VEEDYFQSFWSSEPCVSAEPEDLACFYDEEFDVGFDSDCGDEEEPTEIWIMPEDATALFDEGELEQNLANLRAVHRAKLEKEKARGFFAPAGFGSPGDKCKGKGKGKGKRKGKGKM